MRRKLRSTRSPASPDFSGWNCTPAMWSCSTTAANVALCVGGGDAGRRDGRCVGVREVDLRSVVDGVENPRRTPNLQRVPADVRHLQRCGQKVERPSSRPRPGTSGASSLPSNRYCRPRQMPSSGTPRGQRQGSRLATRRRARPSRRSGRRRERRCRLAPPRSAGADGVKNGASTAPSALRTDVRLPAP